MVFAFIDDSKESDETVAAARKLVREAFDDREECDRIMVRHARHWELSRLAVVDRNTLRLLICELRARRTPPKVAISEALKLAREFSTADSPRFINGVLDAVVKELAGSDAGEAGTDAGQHE